MTDAIASGDALLIEPFDDGRWRQWEMTARSVIEKACGHDWAERFEYETGSAPFEIVQEYPHEPSPDERLEDRNNDVRAKLGIARAALTEIDQELERRGAQPAAPGLIRRDFAFVTTAAIRAIAVRDYEELRAVADRTTKAAALLAGSMVEAVLYDALQQKGVATTALDRKDFVELVDDATAMKLIQERTQKAAHAVRDARNFVHPAVELRKGPLRDVDAKAAIALMNMVLEDLA